jgi:phosphotriesterase-related protein
MVNYEHVFYTETDWIGARRSIDCEGAAVLEPVDSAVSNTAVRKDVWVRIPPAAPLPPILEIECHASPPDVSLCMDPRDLGGAYAYLSSSPWLVEPASRCWIRSSAKTLATDETSSQSRRLDIVARVPLKVETVLGPIAPADLGPTLAHEHLLFDLRCLWAEPPPERAHLIDAEPTPANRAELERDLYHSRTNLHHEDPDLATREAARFRDSGGSTIVDLTTVGLGPKPTVLLDIATATGLNVVAGAGYYRERCLPADVLDRSVEELEDDLHRWVIEGMYGTDVRAGILGELGTMSPIRPFEERQLRAAVRVQQATGIAINVHPSIWAHEHLRIIDILEDAGADLARVAISHCDQLVEPDWHARIAERGVMLSFDTFGAEFEYDSDGSREPTDAERIACLVRLLDAGRASQLLLSHDICSRLQLHYYRGPGYDHVTTTIADRLRLAGASAADIDQMLIANPRRLLAMPA